jgi:sugar-specific transcriptional regulator TrmB
MTEQILRDLGFSSKEIKIYGLILKQKNITPAELARQSKINRTTVYALAKSLIGKGIVAEEPGGKSIRLVPVPGAELKKLIRKEERDLKVREQLISRLAEHLAIAQVGVEYAIPKIRFVEDADVEDYLYDSLKKWTENMLKHDGTWWGFQDSSFVEEYRKWIDWSWKHSPKGIELKLLSNKSPIEERLRGKYAQRQIKFWSNSESFTGTIWIGGDYIVMIVTQAKPFYLVEIHDAVMAHNLRETFKNLWPMVK